MDETRQDPTQGQTRRAGLRVSDAERDTAVTELGEHFGQGRLDQAEFDERVTQALAARTQGDLDGLMADLPRVREAASAQPRRIRPARLPLVVPLLFALILITGFAAGGWRHGWVPWPLWWLLPIMILRFAWWRGGWRRRSWS